MSEDYRAIVDTINRLGRAIDDQDWPGANAVFADQIATDYTSLWGGEPETVAVTTLVDQWRELVSGAWDATQHVITNILADIDGDTATAVANVIAAHHLAKPTGPPVWTVRGTYRLRLTRAGERWIIDALTLRVAWTDGDPGVGTAISQ